MGRVFLKPGRSLHGLIDTQAISGALWVSEDPGWPGKFWVITNDFCEQ
jgi:hypothetical protein